MLCLHGSDNLHANLCTCPHSICCSRGVQLGDMSVVLDDKIKELVCEMSGKDDYEFGDLSVELDKRMKQSVANFCGKDSYEFGDLSKEIAKRTQQGVLAYTGKSDYKFGDITKKALQNLSGKEDYQVRLYLNTYCSVVCIHVFALHLTHLYATSSVW